MFYEKRTVPFSSHKNQSFSFLPHLHREVELFFMLEGSVHVSVDGMSRIMEPGDIAVAFPNTLHSYQVVEEGREESKCEITIFDPSLVSDFQKTFAEKRPLYPFVKKEHAHPDLEYIRQRFSNRNDWEGPDSLLKGYLLVLLSHLLTELPMERLDHAKTGLPVEELLLFVEANFLEPITLEEVAQAAGVSKYYASRLFSEKIGYRFTEYLNILRVRHACQLLCTGNQSVTDIGFASGFNSSSSFYRVFREQTGQTPREYRINNKR